MTFEDLEKAVMAELFDAMTMPGKKQSAEYLQLQLKSMQYRLNKIEKAINLIKKD